MTAAFSSSDLAWFLSHSASVKLLCRDLISHLSLMFLLFTGPHFFLYFLLACFWWHMATISFLRAQTWKWFAPQRFMGPSMNSNWGGQTFNRSSRTTLTNVNAREWIRSRKIRLFIKQGLFHAWSLLHLASSLLILCRVSLEPDSSYSKANAMLFGPLHLLKSWAKWISLYNMQPQVVLLRFSMKQTKILIIGAKVSKNLISEDVFNPCITILM